MGRTGKWWAHQFAGIEPDIVCSAKGIASGMPLGAFFAPARIMNWKPGSHGTTFGGNPVCIAAALSTAELIESQYLENARRMGEYLSGRLAEWTKKFKIVGDVRGRGLMIGIEIVRDQRTKEKPQTCATPSLSWRSTGVVHSWSGREHHPLVAAASYRGRASRWRETFSKNAFARQRKKRNTLSGQWQSSNQRLRM
jgi:4-aminobutyrate aminotransferase-like enzyme